MKQGYKTTEFWVTIIVQIIGILATTGVFTPEQAGALEKAAAQIGGVVAMVASAFGYSLSRGVAKMPRKEKEKPIPVYIEPGTYAACYENEPKES